MVVSEKTTYLEQMCPNQNTSDRLPIFLCVRFVKKKRRQGSLDISFCTQGHFP